MAELVGDLPDADAALVEQRRRRLAERVARDPVEAEWLEGVAQVRVGVGAVAELAELGGEHDVPLGLDPFPIVEDDGEPVGEMKAAPAGPGLRAWLDQQAALVAGDRAPDLDLLGRQVESVPGRRQGLADAEAGAEQADYVTAVGKRALEAIADQGVGWGPHTADELSEIEKRIDVREAEDRVRQTAAEYEPKLRELVGTDVPYELSIEIHDVDDHRAYWVDGAGPRVRLRSNLRQATFTEVRLKHFVQHEILGHGLQCATYAQHAAQGVDWVRLSSVVLPYQVMFEGLAQAMPLFVSPDDPALVTRVRIEHYEQLVRAELHTAFNAGTPSRTAPPTPAAASPGGPTTTSPTN